MERAPLGYKVDLFILIQTVQELGYVAALGRLKRHHAYALGRTRRLQAHGTGANEFAEMG